MPNYRFIDSKQDIAVLGNGITVGWTNGTDNFGTIMSDNYFRCSTNGYGTNVGTTNDRGETTVNHKMSGIVQDSSKSGITARPSIKSLSAYVFYCIKY